MQEEGLMHGVFLAISPAAGKELALGTSRSVPAPQSTGSSRGCCRHRAKFPGAADESERSQTFGFGTLRPCWRG